MYPRQTCLTCLRALKQFAIDSKLLNSYRKWYSVLSLRLWYIVNVIIWLSHLKLNPSIFRIQAFFANFFITFSLNSLYNMKYLIIDFFSCKARYWYFTGNEKGSYRFRGCLLKQIYSYSLLSQMVRLLFSILTCMQWLG